MQISLIHSNQNMLDFRNIIVERMIMHQINAKVDPQDHATAVYDASLLEHDDSVLSIIKVRLIDAAGKRSKAFELEIERTDEGSFVALTRDLKTKTEPEFIEVSCRIADLLAESQTRTSIPGGFIILLQCTDEIDNTAIYIVIKAEPHEALQRLEGQSQISLLKKVFLSPSQKLFKIGVLFEKVIDGDEVDLNDINTQFGCFLFDDQFRAVSQPAEYFYKDFLGFSTSKNSKIQSQRFYDKTEVFIKENVDEFNQQSDLLNALKIEFTTNQETLITPFDFANRYIPVEQNLRGRYIAEIVNELPPSIEKDDALIKTRLTNVKVDFPNKIKISGPNDSFLESVQFLDSNELGEIDLNEEGYTLIRIKGRPYRDE